MLAIELSTWLLKTLEPLLRLLFSESKQSSTSGLKGSRLSQWRLKLENLLVDAQNVGSMLDKHRQYYRLFWFRRGEAYNSKEMEPNCMHPQSELNSGTLQVSMTLMPAIFAHEKACLHPVSKAMVSLMKNEE